MKKPDLINFYRQLSTLYESGVPLIQGLSSLSQEQRGAIAQASLGLKAQLEKGDTLGEAMQSMPTVFPAADSKMVRAGETSGQLDTILGLMARQHETFYQLGKQIMVRLIYPIILVHVAVIVMAILKFISGGMSVMAGLSVIITFVAIVYGGGFAMNIILFGPKRVRPLRALFDNTMYPLPVVKPIIQAVSRLRFARTFQALYIAGVAHPRSVKAAAESCGNVFMEKRFLKAVPLLENNMPFAECIAATGAFPPILQGMVSTGAESGQLETMFDKIAVQCEETVKTRVEVLSVVVPVVLYLIVAVNIAIMVFNFYAGYFRQFETLGF